MTTPTQTIPLREWCKLRGCAIVTAHRWIKNGHLPGAVLERHGGLRLWVIPTDCPMPVLPEGRPKLKTPIGTGKKGN